MFRWMAVVVLLLFQGSLLGQRWIVESYKVNVADDVRGLVSIGLANRQGRHITKLVRMPFRNVTEIRVYGNRLAVLASVGNVSTVGIADLLGNESFTWFYCYEPRLVFNRWIIYVEWYPNHTSADMSDVLLSYDLGLDPKTNHLPGSSTPATRYPSRIGKPIYPHSNAVNLDYSNIAAEPSQATHILGSPVGEISGERIGFVTEIGSSAADYSQKIVVVRLPHGKGDTASSVEALLPAVTPSSRCCMKVTKIEQTSPANPTLSIPEEEYGPSQLEVPIPRSPTANY